MGIKSSFDYAMEWRSERGINQSILFPKGNCLVIRTSLSSLIQYTKQVKVDGGIYMAFDVTNVVLDIDVDIVFVDNFVVVFVAVDVFLPVVVDYDDAFAVTNAIAVVDIDVDIDVDIFLLIILLLLLQ